MSLEKLPSQPEILDESQFKTQSLTLLAAQLGAPAPPGYPARPDRLHMNEILRLPDGRPILRGGPWDTGAVLANNFERLRIHASGLPTDQWSRPLHPWLEDMLTDPAIGVATGKGMFYNWGPNHTADAVVVQANHLLLIQRPDGTLGLPGGFIDRQDKSREAACRREVIEETAIVIPEHLPLQPIYRGPVADVRMTAHAWPETSAFLCQLPGEELEAVPFGQDDALWADWVPLEEARLETLYGSHNLLLELAMRQVARVSETAYLQLVERRPL